MLRNSNVSYSRQYPPHAIAGWGIGTHHFKAITAINHEQHQIHHLAEINHAVQIIPALDKGDSPGLARHDGDRSLGLRERVLGVPLDKRSEQGGLADTWRSDDTDYDRRRRETTLIHSLALLGRHFALIRVTVDEGDVQALLVLVGCTADGTVSRSE